MSRQFSVPELSSSEKERRYTLLRDIKILMFKIITLAEEFPGGGSNRINSKKIKNKGAIIEKMETKYGKYIIKEPMYKARLQGVTMSMHVCAEEGCAGSIFPDFPADISATCITEPLTMSPKPHVHDYDQLLCFFGNNPRNFIEFGAEIEITLGEEGRNTPSTPPQSCTSPKG